MKTSERCIASLKKEEGFTPVAKHLKGDRPEIITGGYGFTHVQPGETFTEAQADVFLRALLTGIEERVTASVKVLLTQGQFDALVSFAYNVGIGHLVTSTLLRKLNAHDYVGAAHEFASWVYAAGVMLPGLVARRALGLSWFEG